VLETWDLRRVFRGLRIWSASFFMRSSSAWQIDAEFPSSSLMMWICLRVPRSFSTARAVLSKHSHQRGRGDDLKHASAISVLDHFGVIGVISANTASAGMNITAPSDVSPAMMYFLAMSSTCFL